MTNTASGSRAKWAESLRGAGRALDVWATVLMVLLVAFLLTYLPVLLVCTWLAFSYVLQWAGSYQMSQTARLVYVVLGALNFLVPFKIRVCSRGMRAMRMGLPPGFLRDGLSVGEANYYAFLWERGLAGPLVEVQVEHKREDVWVGVFWRRGDESPLGVRWDAWVTLVPTWPLHVTWWVVRPHLTRQRLRLEWPAK